MNKVTLNSETIINLLKDGPRTLAGLSRELNLTEEIIALCVLNNFELFNVSKSISDTPLIYLKNE